MTAALIVALSLESFNAVILIAGARIGVVRIARPPTPRKPKAEAGS